MAVLLGVYVKVHVAVGVRVNVAVGSAASAAATAAPASSMPLPQMEVLQLLPPGKARAELCRICSTCAGVRPGLTESINETTPVTCGAAMLVPW